MTSYSHPEVAATITLVTFVELRSSKVVVAKWLSAGRKIVRWKIAERANTSLIVVLIVFSYCF